MRTRENKFDEFVRCIQMKKKDVKLNFNACIGDPARLNEAVMLSGEYRAICSILNIASAYTVDNVELD